MEPYRRRSRRGRCHSRCPPVIPLRPHPRTFNSFFGGLQYCLIMASLIALIYMMLEYHCKTCNTKCDLHKISKSIDEIAVNLSIMNMNYQGLEKKVSVFSQELPKIEGQIEVLEALANRIECGGYGWNPKSHLALPSMDVYVSRSMNKPLNKCSKKNSTNEYVQSKTVQAK